MNASASLFSRSLTKVTANIRHFFSHPLALATGLTFAADSLMFGSWVAHIPHVKTRLGLDDAQLGLALFGMPIGLLILNPLSPGIIARFGLARATTGSTLAMAVAFAVPVWMPDRWALMAALAVVGAAVALINVAMNTCATCIERAEGVYIMSSCHGLWSMGGMVGSGTAAAVIAAGIAPEAHMSVLAVLVMIATLLWLRPALAKIPSEKSDAQADGSKKFTLPTRDLLLMIFIGVAVSLCEGVAFDWSAVYLRDALGAPDQIAALGFTCFSLAMMAMRFTGDVLIPRFGERNMLFFTGLCSTFGLLVIIAAPAAAPGMLGFLLLGAGVALGAPILFNAAARLPGMAPGAGLATYATYSFLGFLAGPPVIGFVGEEFGLSIGFAMVAVLTLTTLLAIRVVKL